MSGSDDLRDSTVVDNTDADLRLLSVLHTIFETQSVTRAAERLGVSQPAVSRSLAKARARFGDPLLMRVGSGMVLTSRAESLREPLGAWLADGRALLSQRDVDPGLMRRIFRLASTDYGVFSVVAPSLSSLATLAPGLELVIRPYRPDSERLLATGALDFVIRGGRPDMSRVHARPLYLEHHLCLAAPDHPGLEDGRMSSEAFFGSPHIVVRVPSGLAADYEGEASMWRRKLIVSDNFMMAPYLVVGSHAVMTAPARAARQFSAVHGLTVFEPPVPLAPFQYWLTWHERSQRDPEVRWLLDYLAVPFESVADA